MPSQANLEYVEALKRTLDGYQSMVLISFQAVSHRDFEGLRRRFREHNGRLQVVRNRLLRIALDQMGLAVPEEVTVGPTALGIAYDDPTVSAKLLLDFVRDHTACAIKAGILEGQLLDAAGVDALSRMPSREQMLAQVVALVGAPMAALSRIVAAPVVLLSQLERLMQDQEAA